MPLEHISRISLISNRLYSGFVQAQSEPVLETSVPSSPPMSSPNEDMSSPNEESHHAESSIEEGEGNSSNDGASSSQSRPSAGERNQTTRVFSSEGDADSLKLVINESLGRTDPESADVLLSLLKGKVECLPQGHTLNLSSSLSMLDFLTVQAPGALIHNGAFTYAPSSRAGQSNSSDSSSASSSSKEVTGMTGSSSSSTGGGGGGDAAGRGNGKNGQGSGDDKGLGHPPNQLVSLSNATSSTQDKPRYPLRCIHNALRQDIYCVNHQTGDKFRTCGGPGLKTVAHLK
jgi:hypothetical protein